MNELVAGSVRLGQRMDWGNDYVTSADTNIAYIWRFLQVVHERGWLYKGHRATERCPRCGTSISAHELIGSYVDLESPSVRVRLPITGRPGEFLVLWTTTPWTLPANVAVAVSAEAKYGRAAGGDWLAVATAPDTPFVEVRRGSELVGWRYDGPFDSLPALAGVEHRVALPHAAHLPGLGGLVHQRRGDPGADARRERRGRVDPGVHGQADGRLLGRHGRLEHLAAPLLWPAATVLPLLVRAPNRDRFAGGTGPARPSPSWAPHAFVEEARTAYEAYATSRVVTAAEAFIDDLSNWYIRLSRRRFWNRDHQAHACLYAAVTTFLRVVGPIVPFLTEYLWQRLVVEAVADAPASVFLAGWPAAREPDRALLAEMETTRRVVELGGQARADAKQRVRQPLARVVVEGAGTSLRFAQLIRDELRVKAIDFGEVASQKAAAKPNFRRLGKRLGPAMRMVAAAMARGEYEDLPDGWVVASGQGVAVGLDVRLTDS